MNYHTKADEYYFKTSMPSSETERILYEDCLEKELSVKTIYMYMFGIKLFRRWFGDEFTKQNGLSFKSRLLTEGSKPKTVNLRLLAFNRYVELIGHPERKVRSLKEPRVRSVENVITEEEFKKLSKSLLDDGKLNEYWMVQFLGKTGCRISELIQFKKEHLDKGTAVIFNKGRDREVYIPKQLIDESREYFESVDSDWLFFAQNAKKNRPITSRGANQRLMYASKKYGIRKEVMHPHSFRHFFALMMMKETKDISLVSDLLNHSSLSTTQIYLRQSKEEQLRRLDESIKW
ncbi:tyrosine-type recombinase/integrase [Streptococcus suis]|uniref:tyrosine-type recombinase/integrase n=1 Tax=Streptococcus suis TaxID=1307 RepID=UPI000CF59E60|nr:tyrosine-type recombinase/integrase [Streptococcus suis]